MKRRHVKFFKGFYEIDEAGTIYNVRTGKIKKPTVNSTGYPTVSLYKNGLRKTYKVHRLVAEHFLPKKKGKTIVNHKNGIKTDPHKDNLEWVTQSENIIHALDTCLLVHTRCQQTGRFLNAN